MRHGHRRPALLEVLDALEGQYAELEPKLQAFVPEKGRFDRLRWEAETLLGRYPTPADRPPLFGLLVGVKDIFHVDGLPTRAGSRLPEEELTGPEAPGVTALRLAGALVAGKTVSTEFAYFAPGPTRNPNDASRTPGGSSSGSAAAVGAGLTPLALGTQTIGSIGRPASFCGIAGLKPSYDRITREGVIPLAPSLDHVGLFAPRVAGLRRPAAALCRDWRAKVTGEDDFRRPVCAVPMGPYLERAETATLDRFHQICERLAGAGYVVRPVGLFENLSEIEARHGVVLAAEAAAVHARWLGRWSDLYDSRLVDLIERGRRVDRGELDSAIQGMAGLRRRLIELMAREGVDLWLSPSAIGEAPLGLESTGDPVMNLPWTQSGLPTLTVPAMRGPAGLPIGLQLTATWYADESLVEWGCAIDEVLR